MQPYPIAILDGAAQSREQFVHPVSPAFLVGAVDRYRQYARVQARDSRHSAAALVAALSDGRRAQARADWNSAFAAYLRLGAVYGAFGRLDSEIDGLPGGLPDGVHDRGFSGFHRLEMGLWVGERLGSRVPIARRLERDLGRLRGAIAATPLAGQDYVTRCHEILEDAQRDFLSGSNVPWSGEGVLATASAVAATEEVLSTLRPFLVGTQALYGSNLGLVRLTATIRSIQHGHAGTLPTLAQLTPREHDELVASVGWALERLQLIPAVLSLDTDAARVRSPAPPSTTQPRSAP